MSQDKNNGFLPELRSLKVNFIIILIDDSGERVKYSAGVALNPIAQHLFSIAKNSHNFIRPFKIMDLDFSVMCHGIGSSLWLNFKSVYIPYL